MYYAKSDPIQSVKEHTDELLKNLEILKNSYGDRILEGKSFDKERFWKLLEIICTYHDLGKCYTPFQNMIRKKLGMECIPTSFNYDAVKHEELSPLFIPIRKFELSRDEERLVYQVIFYHHEREKQVVDNRLVEKIIKEDILPQIAQIEEEVGVEIEKNPNSMYMIEIGSGRRDRISEEEDLYDEYCLLKGLLHRLDHSSSAGLCVEDNTNENIAEVVENYITKKYCLRDIQEFTKVNQEKNLLIIGSTGIGKTEAALLWCERDKAFFTLPIRISINAIFDRIYTGLEYKHVGLLHSTALDYLENEINVEMQSYELSRNLAQKITTCTVDQIFPFVFKYRGYEKIYATLSYSKVIIDEIQAYSPEIVAVILKGLQMIYEIGGKFMVMTATLPGIYKEKLNEMGIEFEYGEFIKNTKRHRILMCDKSIIDDVDIIKDYGENSKVLVICNTVNRAIEVYLLLKQAGRENVNLLHSRFILNDRNDKEEEIKKFSSDRGEAGIWITTQIVEASLDIDFDFLFTEMSTLDSTFQRFGRCFRNREYEENKPNVYIYSKEASGVGYIYDKQIYEMSVELLKPYSGSIIEEKEKIELVDKLYSREMLDGTKFQEKFEEGMRFLDNIVDYETNKKDAQRLFRNIDNVTVIPKNVYEENLELFRSYDSEKEYREKASVKRLIDKLTVSITKSQYRNMAEFCVPNPYVDDIFIIDLKYDRDVGLLLTKDEEYDLDERMM